MPVPRTRSTRSSGPAALADDGGAAGGAGEAGAAGPARSTRAAPGRGSSGPEVVRAAAHDHVDAGAESRAHPPTLSLELDVEAKPKREPEPEPAPAPAAAPATAASAEMMNSLPQADARRGATCDADTRAAKDVPETSPEPKPAVAAESLEPELVLAAVRVEHLKSTDVVTKGPKADGKALRGLKRFYMKERSGGSEELLLEAQDSEAGDGHWNYVAVGRFEYLNAKSGPGIMEVKNNADLLEWFKTTFTRISVPDLPKALRAFVRGKRDLPSTDSSVDAVRAKWGLPRAAPKPRAATKQAKKVAGSKPHWMHPDYPRTGKASELTKEELLQGLPATLKESRWDEGHMRKVVKGHARVSVYWSAEGAWFDGSVLSIGKDGYMTVWFDDDEGYAYDLDKWSNCGAIEFASAVKDKSVPPKALQCRASEYPELPDRQLWVPGGKRAPPAEQGDIDSPPSRRSSRPTSPPTAYWDAATNKGKVTLKGKFGSPKVKKRGPSESDDTELSEGWGEEFLTPEKRSKRAGDDVAASVEAAASVKRRKKQIRRDGVHSRNVTVTGALAAVGKKPAGAAGAQKEIRKAVDPRSRGVGHKQLNRALKGKGPAIESRMDAGKPKQPTRPVAVPPEPASLRRGEKTAAEDAPRAALPKPKPKLKVLHAAKKTSVLGFLKKDATTVKSAARMPAPTQNPPGPAAAAGGWDEWGDPGSGAGKETASRSAADGAVDPASLKTSKEALHTLLTLMQRPTELNDDSRLPALSRVAARAYALGSETVVEHILKTMEVGAHPRTRVQKIKLIDHILFRAFEALSAPGAGNVDPPAAGNASEEWALAAEHAKGLCKRIGKAVGRIAIAGCPEEKGGSYGKVRSHTQKVLTKWMNAKPLLAAMYPDAASADETAGSIKALDDAIVRVAAMVSKLDGKLCTDMQRAQRDHRKNDASVLDIFSDIDQFGRNAAPRPDAAGVNGDEKLIPNDDIAELGRALWDGEVPDDLGDAYLFEDDLGGCGVDEEEAERLRAEEIRALAESDAAPKLQGAQPALVGPPSPLSPQTQPTAVPGIGPSNAHQAKPVQTSIFPSAPAMALAPPSSEQAPVPPPVQQHPPAFVGAQAAKVAQPKMQIQLTVPKEAVHAAIAREASRGGDAGAHLEDAGPAAAGRALVDARRDKEAAREFRQHEREELQVARQGERDHRGHGRGEDRDPPRQSDGHWRQREREDGRGYGREGGRDRYGGGEWDREREREREWDRERERERERRDGRDPYRRHDERERVDGRGIVRHENRERGNMFGGGRGSGRPGGDRGPGHFPNAGHPGERGGGRYDRSAPRHDGPRASDMRGWARHEHERRRDQGPARWSQGGDFGRRSSDGGRRSSGGGSGHGPGSRPPGAYDRGESALGR